MARNEDSILAPVNHQMLPIGGNNSSAAKKAVWLLYSPLSLLGSFVGSVDSGQLESLLTPIAVQMAVSHLAPCGEPISIVQVNFGSDMIDNQDGWFCSVVGLWDNTSQPSRT